MPFIAIPNPRRTPATTKGAEAGRYTVVNIRHGPVSNARAVSRSSRSTDRTPAAVLMIGKKTANRITTHVRYQNPIPTATMMIGRSDSLLVTNSVFTYGARRSSMNRNRPITAPTGIAIASAIEKPTTSCCTVSVSDAAYPSVKISTSPPRVAGIVGRKNSPFTTAVNCQATSTPP